MVYLSLFTYTFSGRSPHGERGLKFTSKDLHYNKSRSLSSRRAWIEISSANTNVSMLGSLSSRRAWIEIQAYMLHYQDRFVALLTESVDWNGRSTKRSIQNHRSLSSRRAWIEISTIDVELPPNASLSSRRAWIEILYPQACSPLPRCRSPHGERGLKSCIIWGRAAIITSLSSRRAWIEIKGGKKSGESRRVALLTESVDWNKQDTAVCDTVISRSPHGERGLKCKSKHLTQQQTASLSSRRAWIEITNFAYAILIAFQVALLTESVDWNFSHGLF